MQLGRTTQRVARLQGEGTQAARGGEAMARCGWGAGEDMKARAAQPSVLYISTRKLKGVASVHACVAVYGLFVCVASMQ